jgi:hypothetical protein
LRALSTAANIIPARAEAQVTGPTVAGRVDFQNVATSAASRCCENQEFRTKIEALITKDFFRAKDTRKKTDAFTGMRGYFLSRTLIKNGSE